MHFIFEVDVLYSVAAQARYLYNDDFIPRIDFQWKFCVVNDLYTT